ncbi:MAG: NRDE family protein [Verrucomicrobiae bacterium]|nr:NRDE family protein [Verrucomicrobiae bacterium]
MCTLTWWNDGGERYEIFFNRDERKTRETASPPTVMVRNGVRFLAPVDPVGGGTWIVVNERGLAAALLNWYDREAGDPPIEGWKSRGELTVGLADSRSRAEMLDRVAAIDTRQYPPFRLVTFAPMNDSGLDVDAWEWSAEGKLIEMAPAMPVCSSSFQTESVIAGRADRLAKVRATLPEDLPEALWNYHHGGLGRGESETPSATSVRMNRPDAQTWSISRITVDSHSVRFLYEAEKPDLTGAAEVFDVNLSRFPQA